MCSPACKIYATRAMASELSEVESLTNDSVTRAMASELSEVESLTNDSVTRNITFSRMFGPVLLEKCRTAAVKYTTITS